jgi:hypothetical protein
MPEKDERKEDGVADLGPDLIGGRLTGESAQAARVSTVLNLRFRAR